jgi:hypothetical protein
MKKRFFLGLFWLLPVFYCLSAQTGGADVVKENTIERLIETISENTDQEIDYTQLIEDLYYFYDHPLNLNTATKDELTRLILLSELQIVSFLDYRKKFGNLISMYEIQLIPGWDIEVIFNLIPFLQVGEVKEKNKLKASTIAKYGKHDIISRVVDLFEEQEGFRRNKLNPTDGYLGDSYQLFTRYRFTYKDKISFGFTGRKDRGEEFFKGTQPQGFDFYSAHLLIKDVGIFRKIALGDFQLNFGQGLTLWNGLAFGKTAFVMNIKRYPVGIRQYTATNAFNFARGAAAEVRLGRFDITGFFSHKKINGNVSETDSLTGESLEVSGFLETGFHRTLAEIAKKHTIGETMYGGNVRYRGNKFNIGATAVQTSYSVALNPPDQAYNLYRFRGDRLLNAGVDYDILLGKFYLFGEMSMSDNGGFAMTHGLQANIDNNLNLVFLYRNFGVNYQNMNSNAVADRTGNSNEQGLYMGFEATPAKYIKMQGYFDVFHYPWMRFGVNGPSSGYDVLGQVTYFPKRNLEAYIRIRHQYRPANGSIDNEYTSPIINWGRSTYRLNFTYDISREVKIRSRVEFAVRSQVDKETRSGWLLYQDFVYKPRKWPVDLSARVALFQIDDFDTRIYTYENDVLYSFSVPGFFDKGMRWYLNLKIKAAKGLDVWFRVAQTYFENRQTIGSGLDMIDGNVRTEYKVQMRYQFRGANLMRKKGR